MDLVILLLVVAAVVWLVGGPLRPGREARVRAAESAERAELEAAKDAKLDEIRELELDWRTGKLSDAEHRAQERVLRAQAIELLRRLDALGEDPPGEPQAARAAARPGPARPRDDAGARDPAPALRGPGDGRDAAAAARGSGDARDAAG